MKKNKEFAQLRWEHLLRNEEYKEFCQWVKDKKANMDSPTPEKFKELEGGFVLISPKGIDENDRKRLSDSANAYNFYLIELYLVFGDIYASTFEEWFEKPEDYGSEDDEAWEKLGINWEKGITTIGKYKKPLYHAIQREKDPLVLDYLALPVTFDPVIFLRINLTFSMKELVTSFKEIIREVKKEFRISSQKNKKREQYEAMIDYLKVYDLKKEGKTIPEIIKLLSTEDSQDPYVIRQYHRRYQLAEKRVEKPHTFILPKFADKN